MQYMQMAPSRSLAANPTRPTAIVRVKPLKGFQIAKPRSKNTPVFPDVCCIILQPNCPRRIRRHRGAVRCVVRVVVQEPKSTVHACHKSIMAGQKVQNSSK